MLCVYTLYIPVFNMLVRFIEIPFNIFYKIGKNKLMTT